MEDWRFQPARCEPGPALQSRRHQDAILLCPRTWKQSDPARSTRGRGTRIRKFGRNGRPAHRRTPALHWCLRCRLPESFFEVPPTTAVALKQFIGLFWTPGTGRIIGKVTRRQSLPHIENGAHYAPTGFDHVRSLEKGLIANHAIVQ